MCIAVTLFLSDSLWKTTTEDDSTVMSCQCLTLVFPLLVIRGTVTDNKEICIADVTQPKEGGGREVREGCLHHRGHTDPTRCCKHILSSPGIL